MEKWLVITNAVKLSLTRLSLWSLCQSTSLSELASPELASRLFTTCWGVLWSIYFSGGMESVWSELNRV